MLEHSKSPATYDDLGAAIMFTEFLRFRHEFEYFKTIFVRGDAEPPVAMLDAIENKINEIGAYLPTAPSVSKKHRFVA